MPLFNPSYYPFHFLSGGLSAEIALLLFVSSSPSSIQFEPFELISLKRLTEKCTFLLALTSAERIGELQGLPVNAGFAVETSAFLSYVPEFIPKTCSASFASPRSFSVPALLSLVGEEDEDELL